MIQKRFPWFLVPVLLAAAALGLPAAYSRGSSAPPYAAVTHSPSPPGLWLAAYAHFTGASVGAFFVSTLAPLFGMRSHRPLTRLSLFIALVCLFAAHLFLGANLSSRSPLPAWLLTPATQPLPAVAVSLQLAYALILIAQLSIEVRAGRAGAATNSRRSLPPAHPWGARLEAAPQRHLHPLTLAGLAIGIGCVAGAGALAASRATGAPSHAGILAVTFMLSAPLSGGALVVAVTLLFATGGGAFKSMLLGLGRFLGVLLACEAIVLLLESLLLAATAPPSQIALLRDIVAGRHCWVFWVVSIALGTLLPLGLIFIPRKQTLGATAIAALFIWLGTFALRADILARETAGAGHLQSQPVLTHIPTPGELGFALFGAGIAGLTFLTGYRLLPLVPRNGARR